MKIGKEKVKLYPYLTHFYIKILRNLFLKTIGSNTFIKQGFRVQGQCIKTVYVCIFLQPKN